MFLKLAKNVFDICTRGGQNLQEILTIFVNSQVKHAPPRECTGKQKCWKIWGCEVESPGKNSIKSSMIWGETNKFSSMRNG